MMLHFALAFLLAAPATTRGLYDFTIIVRNHGGLSVRNVGHTIERGKLTVSDTAKIVHAGGFGIIYGSMDPSEGSVEYESRTKTRDGEKTRTYTLHFRVGADRNEASCDSSGSDWILGGCKATINPQSCKGQESDCSIDIDLTFVK